MTAKTVTQSLVLDARTRSGWVGERPRLAEQQLSDLQDLIGDRVPTERRGAVRIFLNQIYAKAVEDSLLSFEIRRNAAEGLGVSREVPKLTTALSKQITAALKDVRAARPILHISDGLRRAMAAAQFLAHDLPSPAAAARRIDAIVDAYLRDPNRMQPELRELLEAVAISAKSGPDSSVLRQMVRGLAALLNDATGDVPGRSYVPSERDRFDFGERGWFHKLCARLALDVHEALPAEARSKRPPSLTGLVNQELKALREEIDSRAA